MSDDNGVKGQGIPAWQQGSINSAFSEILPTQPAGPSPVTETKHQEAQSPVAGAEGDHSQTSEDLVEQGKKFLLDDSLRDAPLEHKRSFLESQGLSKAHVDKAVEMSKAQATSSQTNPPPVPHRSSTSTPQASPSPQAISSSQQPRDTPPIITYPEFLLHAQKPAPIVTISRLVNTAYVAAAIGAGLWGCSKYLIQPMLSTLTEARHDLAEHGQSKVNELNNRLREVVSVDPKKKNSSSFKDDDDDADSDDTDPTELFHRDYGTQTEAPLVADDASSDTSSEADRKIDASAEADKVGNVVACCKKLANDDIFDPTEDQSTLTVLRVFHEQLESMAYPAYSSANIYGSSSTSGKKDDDEITRFRNEIRSVKGQLLSAKNFPSTGRSAGSRGSLFPQNAGAVGRQPRVT